MSKPFFSRVTHLLRMLKILRRKIDTAVPLGTFGMLPRAQQAIVVDYLVASSRILGLLDCIQERKRAIDHHELLDAYARAETAYVRAGLMPFLPASLRAARLSSCNFDAIERSGLVRLADSAPGGLVTNYASAIRKQVTRRLFRGDVAIIDSAAAERRFQAIIAGAESGAESTNEVSRNRKPFEIF